MNRVLLFAAPILLALTPLFFIGQDLQYSRWIVLALAAGVAWITRPLDRRSRTLTLLLAFGPLWAIVSWGVHGFPLSGLLWTAQLVCGTLLVAALLHDRRPEDYLIPWIVGIAGASVYGLLQAGDLAAAPRDAYGSSDPASVFGLSNFAAETLVLSIPLAVAVFLRARQPWMRGIVLVAAVVMSAYLAAAESRAGWVAGAALLATVLLAWRPPNRRLYWGAVAAAAIFLGAVAWLGPHQFDYFRGARDPSISFRIEAWKAAREMAIEQPVLGAGPGGFYGSIGRFASPALTAASSAVNRSVHHPHNEYLAFLTQLGIPGAVWLLGVLLTLIFVMLRRGSPWQAAGVVAAMVISLFAFPLQQASFWAAFALLAGTGVRRRMGGDLEDTEALPLFATLRPMVVVLLLGLTVLLTIRTAANIDAREAVVLLEQARSASPEQAALLRGRATEHLRQSLSRWPADPEANFNLALATRAESEYREHLEKYVQLVPGDPRARILLARSVERGGDRPAAIRMLRDMLADFHYPPAEVYHHLISLYSADRDYTQARGLAEQGLARNPDDRQLLLDQADVLRLAGKTDLALPIYRKLLQGDAREPAVLLRAGLAFGDAGLYDEARDAFTRGAELAPREAIFRVYLAQLAFAADDPATARRHLTDALQADPNLRLRLSADAPELLPLLKDLTE